MTTFNAIKTAARGMKRAFRNITIRFTAVAVRVARADAGTSFRIRHTAGQADIFAQGHPSLV